MRLSRSALGLAASFTLGLTVFSAPAAAQGATATLADGTALSIRTPLEAFGTEGPIWAIDAIARSLSAVGHEVTIPATVDGLAVSIGGTNDGAGGLITAGTFDRLLDVNAAPGGRDAVGAFSGAARSIYSTAVARQIAPVEQALMEAQYASLFTAAAVMHPAMGLPAQAAATPYSEMSGGTLKCAGHVYQDALGNPYFIPDLELVIEMSENVVLGGVSSAAPGGAGVPASFALGSLLVVMNQDPRFSADITGLGGAPLTESVFFSQLAANPVAEITVIGHMVGDHLMLAQTIESSLVNPGTGPIITGERFRFSDNKNEIRFRGTVDKPLGLALRVQFLQGTTVLLDFGEVLVIDPLTGAAEYGVRSKDEVTVADVDAVSVYLVDNFGVEVARETWLRSVAIGF